MHSASSWRDSFCVLSQASKWWVMRCSYSRWGGRTQTKKGPRRLWRKTLSNRYSIEISGACQEAKTQKMVRTVYGMGR